jgi:hypothetical protein
MNEAMTKFGILELPARIEQVRKSAGSWVKANWSIKVTKPEQSTRSGAKSQNYKQSIEWLCWMKNKPHSPVMKENQVIKANV